MTFSSFLSEIGSSCRTPNGEQATCKSIYDCQLLLDAVQTRNSEQLRFLRESQCGYDKNPLVCCGATNNFSPIQDRSTNRTIKPVNRGGQGVKNNAIPDRSSCGFQVSKRDKKGV